ncbi:MAG: AAA family ATPase [Clostridiales bacterium]|nr:AAA family ATPase [Clostridiales bacterium]
MGFYLNPEDILELYERETNQPYFVDKTDMLNELIPFVKQGGKNICVTKARRFGKSVAAAMIGSFFGKGIDSSHVFSHLNIANNKEYTKYLNQYNLIFINFSKGPRNCESYRKYIDYIENRLMHDLKKAYPNVYIDENDTVGSILRSISMEYNGEKFILVFDEWDYIFHRDYFTEKDRGKFTAFLGDLTKDRAYVAMTYMTGILPIKKYSGSDTMNHFAEYNMATSQMFNDYFGFTNVEIDNLYQRYLMNTPDAAISREELAEWYDGYHKKGKESVYNPNSVVLAFSQNELASYWSKAGEYEELKNYVLRDIDGVREAVILLIAGEPVPIEIAEYASTAQELKKRDEILSVMTVYGFLNYCDGCVRIPNKELQMEFEKIIREEPKYNYVRDLEKESARILKATYDGDEDTVGNVLSIVHTTESPLKASNDEAELSGSVKLAYIAARNQYDMQREAGRDWICRLYFLSL